MVRLAYCKFLVNVGKYTIHGSYGVVTLSETSSSHLKRWHLFIGKIDNIIFLHFQFADAMLTQPMANLKTFGDYILNRKNRV